jgi:hypothetical protein
MYFLDPECSFLHDLRKRSYIFNKVQSERATRQATSRSFPPQHEKSSLVSRLVETWEKLPVHVQGEEKQSVVGKKIKSWASKYVQ